MSAMLPSDWEERAISAELRAEHFQAGLDEWRTMAQDAIHEREALKAQRDELLAYAKCEEEAARDLQDIEAEDFPIMREHGFSLVANGGSVYEQVLGFLEDKRRAAISMSEGES